MSDLMKPAAAEESPENAFFDEIRQDHVAPLDQVPELDEDAIMRLTRRIRLRQIRVDLEKNGGEMPVDPEEKKIFLAQLKDLDSQAAKIKMIGAKEKSNATERLAVEAVLRMAQQFDGQNPYRKDPIPGTATRVRPSITDASNLEPLTLVPDELAVGVADVTYDSLFGEEEKP